MQVLVIRENDSVWAEEAKPQVLASMEKIHQGLADDGYDVVPLQVESPDQMPSLLQAYTPKECIVFNCFEGVETGATDCIQVAHWLDAFEFTFTGADSLALAAAQDKLGTQRTLAAHALPIPRSALITDDSAREWNYNPAIVKVANEHGSESLTSQSIVHNAVELQKQTQELHRAGFDRLMISEFIDGREFTVSLWGNGNLQSLPLLEVDYSACPSSIPRIRSTAAKWETDSQEYQCVKLISPQDLTPELHNRIERVARSAYQALRLRDYGRIDIRVRDGVPYVIDVNCNPDIEQDGTFTTAAQYGGYDYSTMLARIVQFADHRRKGAY